MKCKSTGASATDDRSNSRVKENTTKTKLLSKQVKVDKAKTKFQGEIAEN